MTPRRKVLGPSFSVDGATAPNAAPPPPVEPPPAPAPHSQEQAPEPADVRPEQPAAEPPATDNGLSTVTDPASKLASLLAPSGEADTSAGSGPGAEGLVGALLTPPEVDPDKRLVQCGWRVPAYFKEAVRLLAFANRTSEQEVVIEALRRGIDPKMLARARQAAAGR